MMGHGGFNNGGFNRGNFHSDFNRGTFARGRGFVNGHGAFVHGRGFVGPTHFFRPFFTFHPAFSLGFGLWAGVPFAYPYSYYYPYYPSYPYSYPYYPYYYPYPTDDLSLDDNATDYSGTSEAQPDQSNLGGVTFIVTPGTAEVYVDGSLVGTAGQFGETTQPLGLAPGRHHVEIRAPGYHTAAFDADITAGQVIPYQGTLEKE
jgi:hypothetical protein